MVLYTCVWCAVWLVLHHHDACMAYTLQYMLSALNCIATAPNIDIDAVESFLHRCQPVPVAFDVDERGRI